MAMKILMILITYKCFLIIILIQVHKLQDYKTLRMKKKILSLIIITLLNKFRIDLNKQINYNLHLNCIVKINLIVKDKKIHHNKIWDKFIRNYHINNCIKIYSFNS
jgi:hypothetical protein